MSDRIWIWFADNGNIRKWQRGPFEEGTEYVVAAHADAELDEMTRSCLAEREGRMSLLSIIADIRMKSGLSERPMLSELADTIADRIAHAADAIEQPDPEECERTAAFWGAEATKAMLQGDGDEAKRCLARSKRHALNAVRIRAIASGGKQ